MRPDRRELQRSLGAAERDLLRLRVELVQARAELRSLRAKLVMIWGLPAIWRRQEGYSPEDCADDLEAGLRAADANLTEM